jgi:alpha-beta hydrolase superfamily lysophospholipase
MNSKVEEILFIPNLKQNITVRIPKGIRESRMKTPHGHIQVYEIGSGPTVVFVHGWGGGAPQFFPLMRGLARCGFTALAFDQLGHGKSDSKPATIFQSISTTNFVLQHVNNKYEDGLYAVVGHSTGCIAIANCNRSIIRKVYLFLISPVFKYKIYFLKQLQQVPMGTGKTRKC